MGSLQRGFVTTNIINFMVQLGADKCEVFYMDNQCIVSVSKKSNSLGRIASFNSMGFLSKILGTDKIDLGDKAHTRGCKSCNFGALSSIEFKCYDISV